MSNQSLMSKVVLPYSEALLESAQEIDLVEQISNDLTKISNILLQAIDLKLFLENPLVSSVSKKNVLQQIFSDQIHDNVLKFLLVLVDRRRISLLNAIIDKYLELAYKLDSILIAYISTPISLTESQHNTLINKLKEITNSNKVKLAIEIDSDLIGGLKIQVGSKVIDTSLSGQLKQIAFYLNVV